MADLKKMTMFEKDFSYGPDNTSPPGDTIKDLLAITQTSIGRFFSDMGIEPNQAKDLLVGKIPVTENLAEKLSEVVGGTKDFWLNREAHYRDGESKKITSDSNFEIDGCTEKYAASIVQKYIGKKVPVIAVSKRGGPNGRPRYSGYTRRCEVLGYLVIMSGSFDVVVREEGNVHLALVDYSRIPTIAFEINRQRKKELDSKQVEENKGEES